MRSQSLSTSRPRLSSRWLIALAIVMLPLAAQAYVGPGAGLSLLGALWGVLCAVGAAFAFLIMWPIRRMRRRRREQQAGPQTTTARADTGDGVNPARTQDGQPSPRDYTSQS